MRAHKDSQEDSLPEQRIVAEEVVVEPVVADTAPVVTTPEEILEQACIESIEAHEKAVANTAPAKNIVGDYTREMLAIKTGKEIITAYDSENDNVTALARIVHKNPALTWRGYIAMLVAKDLNADITPELFTRSWNTRSAAEGRIELRENPQPLAVANTTAININGIPTELIDGVNTWQKAGKTDDEILTAFLTAGHQEVSLKRILAYNARPKIPTL